MRALPTGLLALACPAVFLKQSGPTYLGIELSTGSCALVHQLAIKANTLLIKLQASVIWAIPQLRYLLPDSAKLTAAAGRDGVLFLLMCFLYIRCEI